MRARHRLPYAIVGIAALALGVGASCGSDSDSAVIVHVQGPTALPAIFRFHAILSNDETADSKLFPQALPATPQAIAMPTAFSITLPRSRTGEIDIALDALGATGDILANGTGSTTINVGGTAEVTITLAAGISLCGNGQIDSGEQCDDGDRVTSGTCDFRCQMHTSMRGKDGGLADGDGGNLGTGGAGTGGKGGAGGGIGGSGGRIGTGGTGAGGAGVGGIIGTGGRAVGGSGAGGSGAGGNGGCAIELLTNGTFDAGPVAWTITSPINTQMIYMSGNAALGGVMAASPYYTALLGRNLVTNPGSTTPVQETLAQPITVPSVANTITVQGFFQSPTSTTIACPTCSSAVIEIVHSPDIVNVTSWTGANGMGSWMAFGTTIDATPFRGMTVLFQLRAVATSTTVVPFYFDGLSAKVDRCGP
jgi:cysteine-rich repeat protein